MHTEDLKKYLPATASPTIHGRLVTYPISAQEIVEHCVALFEKHLLPLKFITAARQSETVTIFYIFGVPDQHVFLVPTLTVKTGSEFPSLASHLPSASLYERLIKESFGLIPIGHPNPQPVHDQGSAPYVFTEIPDEGIYEIPVGPVHAGIIEPGHFRFSMAGEEIVNLEAQLGFVHKGTETLFATASLTEKIVLAEHVAGDTAFTHSLAFTQALEELLGIFVPDRANYLRVMLSELERLANHFNDVGFIMFDTGYNGGGAHGVRLREAIMQLNERLSGHRFLRHLNTVGGLQRDIPTTVIRQAQQTLDMIKEDVTNLLQIAGNSQSFMNRLKGTGVVNEALARGYGALGVAARGAGVASDSRQEFPYAAYAQLPFTVAKQSTGDVYARYKVRTKEILSSFHILEQVFKNLPEGAIRAQSIPTTFPTNALAIGVSEGWRGEIMYLVATDRTGQISRVAVRDPSMVNWQIVPHAAAGNVLLDFPLINKSFNLSYSGNDL